MSANPPNLEINVGGIVSYLMKNKTVSKLMAIAMIVVGYLDKSGGINSQLLTGGGIVGFIAHILNPSSDAA